MAEYGSTTSDKPAATDSKNSEGDALTVQSSLSDFKKAYQAKKKLIDREKEDFLFALGEQWSPEDLEKLKNAKMKAITDNRIAPNIFLVTGLERQNRSDFKAFPTGEEDSVKADIATALFRDTVKNSDFAYKSSDQFKDGITCGESHLELYLDYTENLLNGSPCWRKLDGNVVFPEPGFTEYDFKDCRYVYKVLLDISKEDLINLFPKKKDVIEKAESGRLDMEGIMSAEDIHIQPRDYAGANEGGDSGEGADRDGVGFDLIERYYKKWVATAFIGDKQTGKIQIAESPDAAKGFIMQYQQKIQADQAAYQQATQAHGQAVQQMLAQHVSDKVQAEGDPTLATLPPAQHLAEMNQQGKLPPPPPPPPPQDPERFIIITRQVPEIWCFAHVPGINEELANERGWFYPKWKNYPFVPYFARFSTAPLTGDQRHLLIQGLVHGVKGVQEKHNKAEMLMLRHLNSTANSGWIAEEDSWVDEGKVQEFGSVPGINLYHKKGTERPERINPSPLSQGHAEIAAESAESIKAQLGINADLLATQQGGSDSGRAIALRQKQGLLMLQELFDNLSRTRMIAGKFMLSQLGEIYDTDSAKKVLGEAFMKTNFPPPMLMNPKTMQQEPMQDPQTGLPMDYDKEMAEVAIAEVLSGELGKYDVTVGEAVASETQKLANSNEVQQMAKDYPGLIPPDILIEESQLPASAKSKILSSFRQAQAAAQAQAAGGGGPAKK